LTDRGTGQLLCSINGFLGTFPVVDLERRRHFKFQHLERRAASASLISRQTDAYGSRRKKQEWAKTLEVKYLPGNRQAIP